MFKNDELLFSQKKKKGFDIKIEEKQIARSLFQKSRHWSQESQENLSEFSSSLVYFYCVNEHGSEPVYREQTKKKPMKSTSKLEKGDYSSLENVNQRWIFFLLRREVCYANLEIS